MQPRTGTLLTALSLFVSANVFAASYPLVVGKSIVGDMKYTFSSYSEDIVKIAERYDVGFNEMQNANPYVHLEQMRSGINLHVPTKHLLPNGPREGIVVNLPEMRMYYYPTGTNQVLTYPIGIGKIGKTIPIANTKITRKTINPVWVPTPDIREFNLKQGIVLPQVMPAGPDNPLGPFAIYMGIPTYLIHSTIFPESVGKRASFGCIRMYESDIKQFFPTIESGIPVSIINSPVKVAWQDNRLYLEAHTPLEEHYRESTASLPGVVHMVHQSTSKPDSVLVDWQLVSFLSSERDGIPHEVGMKISSR